MSVFPTKLGIQRVSRGCGVYDYKLIIGKWRPTFKNAPNGFQYFLLVEFEQEIIAPKKKNKVHYAGSATRCSTPQAIQKQCSALSRMQGKKKMFTNVVAAGPRWAKVAVCPCQQWQSGQDAVFYPQGRIGKDNPSRWWSVQTTGCLNNTVVTHSFYKSTFFVETCSVWTNSAKGGIHNWGLKHSKCSLYWTLNGYNRAPFC